MYVTLFSMMNILIESDFDDGDYTSLPRFIIMLFSNFRIGVGDMQVPTYGKWADKEDGIVAAEEFKSA